MTRPVSLRTPPANFSALQRAEIAEMTISRAVCGPRLDFSALQRAEIAETVWEQVRSVLRAHFSALQRAEIAETKSRGAVGIIKMISVLFNEPKLLKTPPSGAQVHEPRRFQCSSTSRNC